MTVDLRHKKRAAAVLDYTVDWEAYLGDDTIATSSWSVTPEGGLAVASDSNSTTDATAWLTGGAAGTAYQVTNQITTAAGRTDSRTIEVTVV